MKIERKKIRAYSRSSRVLLASLSMLLTTVLISPSALAQNSGDREFKDHGTLRVADASGPEKNQDEKAALKLATPNNRDNSNPAIELLVDMSLGLCDEQAAKERLKALKIKKLKEAVSKEIEALKSDLFGVRQVTAEQFAKTIKRMEIVSSGHSIVPIGVSKDKAYLEFNLYLKSKCKYVVVVTSDLSELPKDVVEKIK